jgi:hypothetical protein
LRRIILFSEFTTANAATITDNNIANEKSLKLLPAKNAITANTKAKTTTCPISFCITAIKYITKIKNITRYGNKSKISALSDFFSEFILLAKLHAKKKTNPILKNSTGANENPGSLIHRFAPPAEVTIESGSECIKPIKKRHTKNMPKPIVERYFSGLSKDIAHITKMPKNPAAH